MKSGAKERVAFDEELPGFAVKVLPSGRRVFIFQYRHGGRGGRLRRITISEFRDPPLTELDTVDGARRKAAEYRAEVLRGEDPFATLQAAKAAEIEAARREAESPDPKTVTNLATEYLARWASKKRDGGTADKRALDKDVLRRSAPYLWPASRGATSCACSTRSPIAEHRSWPTALMPWCTGCSILPLHAGCSRYRPS
jgi:Arm DNA-binding domain